MQQVDEVAALFFWLEDWADRHDASYLEFCQNNEITPIEFPEFEDARLFFESRIKMLGQPNWKDGKHCGDCTGIAGSCPRCFAEQYREYAEQWLEDWNGTRPLFRRTLS